jgi:hypothetical protein
MLIARRFFLFTPHPDLFPSRGEGKKAELLAIF